MSAFQEACNVEQRSWEILEPYLKAHAFDGRFVRTAKGPLSLELQKTVGDVLVNSSREHITCIEVKAEERHTGNLFFERWSNRARFTPGWFETLKTDLIWYHFLDLDIVYELPFERLRKWFYHGNNGAHPIAHNYVQKKQGKYIQLNDTWGYIVCIEDIQNAGLIRKIFKPELEMKNAP